MRGASLPRGVWLLGWVSLATDAASEGIYALLPFFLTTVLGAGALSLGIVEGAADAVNSVLKLASGRWSDRTERRRPLVVAGYALSSAVRPLMSLAASWTQVFAVRFVDRIGKGIRGAPRDAWLASLATPETRGRVFGFHRGMDHAGAIVGPVVASLFLVAFPGQYRALFALSIVPGLIAVLLVTLVREADHPVTRSSVVAGADVPVPLPPRLRRFLLVLAVFTLGNSTDAFLLLRLTDAAGGPQAVPLMWAALHVVKASASFVGGAWSDRVGRPRVIALGWCVYAAVYLGFAASRTLPVLLTWFLVYGVYFGLTEGTEKALVADLSPPASRGTAFGLLTAVQGFGALAASLLFGVIWTAWGSAAAFGTGAGLAMVATAALLVALRERPL